MTVHLIKEIERITKSLLALSAMVENNLRLAVRAVEDRDPIGAREIINGDYEIDKREVEVEEDCLKVLALHQPVAIDLRVVVAILKINNDLERIGDLAVNIAERAVEIAGREPAEINFDYREMARKAKAMVAKSLDAFVYMDAALAREVCAADDEVDEMKSQMFDLVIQASREHHELMEQNLQYLLVTRHLERVADHATNIAEDVIYLLEGEIVRHRMSEINPVKKPE